MNRTCKKCNVEKTLEEFSKRKEGLNNRRHECKLCFRKRQLVFQRTRLGMSGCIYRDQEKDSKRRNHLPPDYSLESFREWLFNCENFELLYNNWVSSEYNKNKRPSVDRLDDSIGYNFNNIQLLTWEENNEKHYAKRRKLTREPIKIKFEGEDLNLTDYCKLKNLNYSTVSYRINKLGWSVEKVINYKN